MTDCAAPRHDGQGEPTAILDGGPFHGRVMRVAAERLIMPYLAPGSLEMEIRLPRRRWWHRLLRRPVPFPPAPPTFRNLAYRRTGERREGTVVYRYEEPA